jgi:hypothetical protein
MARLSWLSVLMHRAVEVADAALTDDAPSDAEEVALAAACP